MRCRQCRTENPESKKFCKKQGAKLLAQAFLERIVNAGGRIEREYGLGRMQTDLQVLRPYPCGVQKGLIELKVLRRGFGATLRQGSEQTWQCADRAGAEKAHLVLFDRTIGKPGEEKIFHRTEEPGGRVSHAWGM